MKRHIQEIGVRYWSGDDLIELQSETLQAIDGFFGQYGSFILAGCTIETTDNHSTITRGLVVLQGHDHADQSVTIIAPFAGAENVSLPLYLTLEYSTRKEPYKDGNIKPIACDYYAKASPIKPADGVSFLLLNDHTPRFSDVIQDSKHRFVSDTERKRWNECVLQEYVDQADGLLEKYFEARLKTFEQPCLGEVKRVLTQLPFDDHRYILADGREIPSAEYPELTEYFPSKYNPSIMNTQFTADGAEVFKDTTLDARGNVLFVTDTKVWVSDKIKGVNSCQLPEVAGGYTVRKAKLVNQKVFILTNTNFMFHSDDNIVWTTTTLPVSGVTDLTYFDPSGYPTLKGYVLIAGNNVWQSADLINFTKKTTPTYSGSYSQNITTSRMTCTAIEVHPRGDVVVILGWVSYTSGSSTFYLATTLYQGNSQTLLYDDNNNSLIDTTSGANVGKGKLFTAGGFLFRSLHGTGINWVDRSNGGGSIELPGDFRSITPDPSTPYKFIVSTYPAATNLTEFMLTPTTGRVVTGSVKALSIPFAAKSGLVIADSSTIWVCDTKSPSTAFTALSTLQLPNLGTDTEKAFIKTKP